MLQLYINNKPAIIKSGSSFKLTRENPYFSDAGDYTLDITLPLRGCIENQAIFGSIHRKDVSLVSLINKKYTAKLVAAPITLDGSVVVTQVDQDEIKVQLVAGRSEVSIYAKNGRGEDYYINQLDLGQVYESLGSFSSLEDLWNALKVMSEEDFLRVAWGTAEEQETYHQGGLGFVLFPIYAEGNGAYANICRINYWYDYSGTYENYANWWFGFYGKSEVGETTSVVPPGKGSTVALPDAVDDYTLAAQPYLWYVVEKVLKAIGYNIDERENCLRTNWAKDVFIANPKGVLKLKDMMPEWTVTEFLKEVRKFCGVLFVPYIEDGQKYVRITDLADSYSDIDTFLELAEVSDEWNAEVESDDEASSEDVSTADVSYAYPESNDFLNVPEEVWQSATIIYSATRLTNAINDINTYIASGLYEKAAEVAAEAGKYIYHDSSRNKDWCLVVTYDDDGNPSKAAREEIDGGGALIRSGRPDERGDTIELKICPARSQYFDVHYRGWATTSDGGNQYAFQGDKHDTTVVENVPCLMSSGSTVTNSMVAYNVYNAITGEDDKEDEQVLDAIEVAFNPGLSLKRTFTALNLSWSVNIPFAYGLPWYETEEGRYLPFYQEDDAEDSFSYRELCLKWGEVDGVVAHAINKNIATDTRVQHVFSFTDWGDFSPEDVYLIHGKKYACTKIEITIDERGLQPMKKGYFVEIN